MSFSHHQLLTQSCGLKMHFQASRWLIAVSGGLDSMCLLHALVRLSQEVSCPALRVLHVNHGLHLKADQWQQKVEAQCQRYGVVCISQKAVLCAQQQRQLGLEATARNARYDIFKQQLRIGEVLLLGQHADDQTETLLLRLLRGAGVAGLRAMPQQRRLGLGALVRPLLYLRQSHLHEYASQYQLTWCEDPSNQDTHFDRNYLRHQVLPSLRQRWPALDQRVATVTAVMGDTQALLDEVAAADFTLMVKKTPVGECLPLSGLKVLSRARRHNLLRYWLGRNDVLMPDYAAMQRIDKDFLHSAIDAQPYLYLGHWCLRRDQGNLHLMPRSQNPSGEIDHWFCMLEKQMLLNGSIDLPDGMLCLKKTQTVGLALASGDLLMRRFRTGGERCKPLGRMHSQSLKKLLQEAKVPAWERDQLPLFYLNGELAMVANLWVSSGFEAGLGEPAWCWQEATLIPRS